MVVHLHHDVCRGRRPESQTSPPWPVDSFFPEASWARHHATPDTFPGACVHHRGSRRPAGAVESDWALASLPLIESASDSLFT